MEQVRRPGGLTALAVINFILGSFDIMGFFMLLVVGLFGDRIDNPGFDEARKTLPQGAALVVLLCLTVVGVVLAFVAATGYLGMKRVRGRVIGSIYALVIASEAVVTLLAASQYFGITHLIGFIYPAITLILLNTTFKDDLVY